MADDQQWRTQDLRQKVVAQIDEAIRQSGNPTTKNSAEMENHVFQKARSKEEYLGYVARLILHVREMNSKTKQGGAQGMPPQQGQMGPRGNAPMTDPINALQNLARQDAPNMPYMGPGGGSQLGAALAGQGPGSQQMQQMQPGMNPGVMPPGGPQGPGKINPGMMNQVPVPNMGPQGQQQFANMIMAGRPRMPNDMMQNQLQMQQLQKLKQQVQQVQMQGSNQSPQPQPVMQMQGKPATPQGMNEQLMMANNPMPTGQFAQQMPNQQVRPGQYMGHSPNPMQISHSPVQGMNVPTSQSPVGYMPQPSPQMLPSPVGSNASQSMGRTPGSISNVPSPGSALNTPVMANSAVSPANRNMTEDQAYVDKVRQLQKHIEPLRRVISRMDRDEGNYDKKKELFKMKGLLELLTNPSRRLPMETLLKCEQVLEKMEFMAKPMDPGGLSFPPSSTGSKEQNICQPLLDAINAHIRSPLINHTLQRTFGPAVAALHGTWPYRSKSPPLKKRKRAEEEFSAGDIPDVLQGEIARLDQRFKVNLDPLQHSGAKTIHLVCQLDDKNLPCVPPITVTVPENYPKQPPYYDTSSEEYDSTPFLQSIQKALSSRLMRMPEKFSITSLLDTWEMSVRQACAPLPLIASTS